MYDKALRYSKAHQAPCFIWAIIITAVMVRGKIANHFAFEDVHGMWPLFADSNLCHLWDAYNAAWKRGGCATHRYINRRILNIEGQ